VCFFTAPPSDLWNGWYIISKKLQMGPPDPMSDNKRSIGMKMTFGEPLTSASFAGAEVIVARYPFISEAIASDSACGSLCTSSLFAGYAFLA
jgi:hypothetical protein